ncbi:MAG: type 1 glutamine amidotransferase [Candidatus Caenarcaniphilales bacterium]|nr:type 1 glutamine amidotransferase [Candidatus Caenarcaniphilales bacterium]
MSNKKEKLKILLLQIRDNHSVREEELSSFAQFTGLEKSQFTILNVFDQPSFDINLDSYDSLFVGGASEASVLEPDKYPFVLKSEELLLKAIDINKPVFASCFGFQLAVTALGGQIIRDQKDYEMGSIPIQLTTKAKDDVLLKDTPNNFHAISVHRERATKLPANCELLAYTDQCCHSFKLTNKPFWAFQFHPEVDKPILIQRLSVFRDKYTKSDEQLKQVFESVVETPESNLLLTKFVDRVLLTS